MTVPIQLAFDAEVTTRDAKRGLTLVQAGSYDIRWTFKQSGVAKDLSAADTVTFIYANDAETTSVTITGSIDDAVNGIVLVPFTPAKLAVNSATEIYNWNLLVSGGGDTLAYAYGDLDIPVNLAAGSIPALTLDAIDYSNVGSYTNVDTNGPYRAGDNIEFEANADGSQDINLTADIVNINSFSVNTTSTVFTTDKVELFFYEPSQRYALVETYGNVGSITTNVIFVTPER